MAEGVQLRRHELRVAEPRTVQRDHDWRKAIDDRLPAGMVGIFPPLRSEIINDAYLLTILARYSCDHAYNVK